jgi:HSP20 family protein
VLNVNGFWYTYKGRNQEQEEKKMQEQLKLQEIPVKVYKSDDRLMVVAPMPGLEPENIVIEVTGDGHLILNGDVRGMLKDVKELVLDEWSVGFYRRDLELPVSVNGKSANVTYGNGVVTVALPFSDRTIPSKLTLERLAPTHGERKGNAGHPPTSMDEL